MVLEWFFFYKKYLGSLSVPADDSPDSFVDDVPVTGSR